MDRLKRFEYCGEGLFPYIEKVLNLLHPEKKEAFLSDEFVQVISSDKPERGFQITFHGSVKSIVYINICHIKKQCVVENGHTEEDCFIYGIAHEMAHHFAWKGERWLLEKEANDWLKKWGNFDELIKKMNHREPIDEKEGYILGYNRANTQDKDWLWEAFFAYLVLWDKKELYRKQVDEIIDRLKSKVKSYLDEEDCNTHYLEGLAFGIMKRVREILAGKTSGKGGD